MPCYGNRAVWGSTMATETDFLRDPDGHGWHLDRALVDAWLLRTAVVRGTILLTPARQHCGDGWQARVATIRGEVDLAVRFAIDAGGRAAPLARLLGARRRRSDRLVCGWLHGPARGIGRGAGLTIVEAVEDGWWYTTPIPGGRRVLAFLIDADLPAARIAHQRRWLNETAARAREITAVLAESQFAPAAGGFIAAHSSVLVSCAGDRWLAVGDASMSFDPLAAQGLLHALFTGLCRGRNRGRLLAPPAKDQSAAARLRKQRVRLLQQFRQTADDAVGAKQMIPLRPHVEIASSLRSSQ